jgi:hypothetical protein
LKNWTCGQLIEAVFEDAKVKHYFKQVGSFFKQVLKKHGGAKNSPDGIQHKLFHSRCPDPERINPTRDNFRHYIKHVLIEENIIQIGKEDFRFNLGHYARYAMQQPYKMIEIANAILPPVIVDDKEQNGFTSRPVKRADNLIAPNSFYVQANVTETQISFILNKVIEVPSSKTGIELFTIQERLIEMEDIVETVLHVLWNHYQSMVNLGEQQHALFSYCQDHDNMELVSSHYKQFKKNAKKLMNFWVRSKFGYVQALNEKINI